VPTNASEGWKTIRFAKEGNTLLIRAEDDEPINVHALTIGNDDPGIRYISLGLPNATVQTPLLWDEKHVEADLKSISPDLIIVSYGTTEANSDRLNIVDYQKHITTLLERFQKHAPQASILIIGPPDMAKLPNFAAGWGRMSNVCRELDAKSRRHYSKWLRKHDPRLAHWHPPLNLDVVRATLRHAAASNQAFFWDWSKPMGGTCGIHAWVHTNPPLAAPNHLYMTDEGSKRAAQMLFRELMAAFNAYERNQLTSAK
jgi:hypothetical protein